MYAKSNEFSENNSSLITNQIGSGLSSSSQPTQSAFSVVPPQSRLPYSGNVQQPHLAENFTSQSNLSTQKLEYQSQPSNYPLQQSKVSQPDFQSQPNSITQQDFSRQSNSTPQQPGFSPQANLKQEQPGIPPQPNSMLQQSGFPPQVNSKPQQSGFLSQQSGFPPPQVL